MATLAIAAVGAAIGYGVGGTAFWMSMGWTVGSMIGSWLFPEEYENQGPRLQDLTVQTSTLGANIPILYGSGRLSGNIFWSGGRQESPNEQESGGKGMAGAEVKHTSYTYTCSFAVGLCEGPIVGIRRIWANSKLIYDASYNATADYLTLAAMESAYGDMEIFLGSDSQTASSIIEAVEGSGNVPGYRDLAYVVFENMPLSEFGNNPPNISVEVIEPGSASSVSWEFGVPASFPSGILIKGNNLLSADYGSTDTLRVHDGLSDDILFSYPVVNTNLADMVMFEGDIIHTTGSATIYRMDANTGKYISRMYVETPGGYGYEGIAVYGNTIILGSSDSDVFVYISNPNFVDEGDAMPSSEHTIPDYINANPTSGGGHRLIVHDGDLISSNDSDGDIIVYNGITLSIDETISTGLGSVKGIATWEGNLIVMDTSDVYVHEEITAVVKSFNTFEQNNTTLSTIVTDLCAKVGVTDIDVSALTDSVHGYTVTRRMPCRKALEPLMATFRFDAVEAEYEIDFIKRGGSSVGTITADELAAHLEGKQKPPTMTITRAQETDLPQQITVKYIDTARDYEVATQTARRLVTSSNEKIEVSLPIAMDADAAIQAAEILLSTAWTERMKYKVATTMEYCKILPGDIFVADSITMRALNISLSAPGILSIETAKELAANYTSTATGESPTFDSQTVVILRDTSFLFLDIPCLRDIDDETGFYMAAYGYDTDWKGAILYRSMDEGATFDPVMPILNASTVGVTTDALDDGPSNVWDENASVNITIRTPSATLSNATAAAVLAGANAAAIGVQGAWEIIHFKTATLEGDGTYTLTGLLRGRYGSDWATGGHAISDNFVLLEASKLVRVILDSSDLGIAVDYKVPTIGSNLYLAEQKPFTCDSVKTEPLEAKHAKIFRDAAGNATITWIRRTRIAGEWRDLADVPIGEDSESYSIDIYDNGNIVRNITATSETATYTAAQQTTDFGSTQSSIHMIIYQVSAINGNGYGEDVTL